MKISSIKITDSFITENIFSRFFIYFYDDKSQILQQQQKNGQKKITNIISRLMQKVSVKQKANDEMLQRTKMLDTCFILLAGISLNSILNSLLVCEIACACELICSLVMFIMIVSLCECCQNSCIESHWGSKMRKKKMWVHTNDRIKEEQKSCKNITVPLCVVQCFGNFISNIKS